MLYCFCEDTRIFLNCYNIDTYVISYVIMKELTFIKITATEGKIIMHKAKMSVLLFSFFVSAAASATAGDSTLSAGYAGIQTGKYLDDVSSSHRLAEGVNFKYRYDMDDVWGLIGSMSYARHHDYLSLEGGTNYADFSVDRANIRLEYLSLQSGPVYRFNEFLSGYLMTGLTTTKYEGSGGVDAFYHPDGDREWETSWYERDSVRKKYRIQCRYAVQSDRRAGHRCVI